MAEIFPVYFAMQAVLPAVLVLTYPAGGVAGVLDPVNRWDVLVPLAGVFLCALANLAVVGPATTRVMEERRRLGGCFTIPLPFSCCVAGLGAFLRRG
jgi:hypothetical protein